MYAEDHAEWLGFLNILKKSRAKAPVNGLIVIVSIAELISQSPEHSLKLAKNLRARIQDLTERLEVVVPVYLVFSKMDLIAGFTSFSIVMQRKNIIRLGARLCLMSKTHRSMP